MNMIYSISAGAYENMQTGTCAGVCMCQARELPIMHLGGRTSARAATAPGLAARFLCRAVKAVVNFMKSLMCEMGEAYSRRAESYINRVEKRSFLDRADDLFVSTRYGLKAA